MSEVKLGGTMAVGDRENHGAGKRSRQRWNRKIEAKRLLPVATLAALLLVIGGIKPLFFSVYSFQTQASAIGPLLLLACGEFGVILLGGIDLSIGQVAALGTVLPALWLGHGPGVLIVLAVVLLMTCMGALNGLVNVVLQIPTFITTLGTLGLWTGVALVVSNATSVQVKDSGPIQWFAGMTLGFPNSFIVGVAAVVALGLVLQKLRAARLGMYSVGNVQP